MKNIALAILSVGMMWLALPQFAGREHDSFLLWILLATISLAAAIETFII